MMRTNKSLWILLGITFLTFARVLTHDFVYYDDNWHIYDNPGLNAPGQFWREPFMGLYVPLVYTVWSFVAGIFGATSAWAFHALNLVLHMANAILVFKILCELSNRNDLWRASLLGALVFALHPLQVEAVAWATALKDVLSAALALGSLWMFIRARKAQMELANLTNKKRGASEQLIKNALRGLMASWVLLLLALLSKPSYVVLPLVFLSVDLFLFRQPLKSSLRGLLAFFALLLPFAWITVQVQPATMQLFHTTLGQRLLVALDAVGFYAAKIVWPWPLTLDYGRTPEFLLTQGGKFFIALGGLVLLGLIAALVVASRRRSRAGVAAAVAVLGVLPVLGLTPFVFQWVSTVSDRYVYFSLFGVALACVILLERRPELVWPCMTLLATYSVVSAHQSGYWKNSETLFARTAEISPHSPNIFTVQGNYYLREKRDEEKARAAYERAVQLAPAYPQARTGLGNMALEKKQFDVAETHYRAILERYPHDLMATMNLGYMRLHTGRAGEALQLFQKALATNPKLSPTVIERAQIESLIAQAQAAGAR